MIIRLVSLSAQELVDMLLSPITPQVMLPDGRVGIIDSVQREDGSGRSFNVRIDINGKKEWVYHRPRS